MRIALLGDIAPFGRYCVHRNPNIISQLDGLRDFLQDYDLVVGNLETPFVDTESPVGSKSAHVRSHPKNVEVLKHMNVSHVTLANNHIGDYGPAGYEKTKRVLSEAGIDWFGTEGRSLRITLGSEKVSLSGYCSWNTNPSQLSISRSNALNMLDVDRVISNLDVDSREGFFPILAVHSGQEHVHMPSAEDVEFARGLASKFDYVYYGHHPHVIQGAETVKNSRIFYSLGNLIFDDVFTPRDLKSPLIRLSEANKTGAIATVEIIGGRVSSSYLTPIYMGENSIEIGSSAPSAFLEEYDKALEGAGTDEYSIVRAKTIEEYINGRRQNRTLKWYLKRLNFNSLGIISASRLNSRRHNKEFSSKLYKLR